MVRRKLKEVSDNDDDKNHTTEQETIQNKEGFNVSIEDERTLVENKLILKRKLDRLHLRYKQDHPLSLIDKSPEEYIIENYIPTLEEKEFLRNRDIEPYKKHWKQLEQKKKRVLSKNIKVIRDEQDEEKYNVLDVYSLSIYNDKLYVGSENHTIKVWNLHRGGKINCDILRKDFYGLRENVDFIYVSNIQRIASTHIQTIVFHGDNLLAGISLESGLMSFDMKESDFNPDDLDSDEDEDDYKEDKKCLSYGERFGNHIGIVNALIIHGDLLFSASEDNTIGVHKISKRDKSGWRHEETLGTQITPFSCLMETKKETEKRAKQGHTNSVTCLAIHDNKLYSGSTDGTIRVWTTVKPYKCIAILKCPQEYPVVRENTPEVLERKIVAWTGNRDQYDVAKYRVIENTNFTMIKTREREQVETLLIHNNKLFVGSDDRSIHVFDTETHQLITSLSGHSHETTFNSEGYLGKHVHCGVRCMVVHNNKLYSGGDDWNIRVWNTETYKEEKILELHYRSVTSLTIHEKKLFSSSGRRICVTPL